MSKSILYLLYYVVLIATCITMNELTDNSIIYFGGVTIICGLSGMILVLASYLKNGED